MVGRWLTLLAALHLSLAPAFARDNQGTPQKPSIEAPPGAPTPPEAPDEEPPTPGTSDDWLDAFFKRLFNLTNVTNQLNWVYYAGAGTAFYYKFFYRPALDAARTARLVVKNEFETLDADYQRKKSALEELDRQLEGLEQHVAAAEKALPELDAKIREASGQPDGYGKHTIFKGLQDYGNLALWLSSDAGRAFTESDHGQKWHAQFSQLVDKTSKDVEEPLAAFIKSANRLYPTENFRDIISTHNLPNGRPGSFAAVDYLRPKSDQISLHDIPGHLKSRVRGRCDDYLSSLARDRKALSAKNSAWDFWVRKGNFKAPFIHALAVSGSLAGTFWLYRATRYSDARTESARRARQKLKAEDDIFGEFADPAKHAPIQPFEDIVADSLREQEAQLVKSLERNLTADELAQLNIKDIVHRSLERKSLDTAMRRAIPYAAKRVQGEFTNLAALQAMINASKTDPEKREQIFRPFLKTMYRELFNNLWADLSVGDPSDNIGVGVLRQVMDGTTARLTKDTKIQAPSQQKTPKAPGVPVPGNLSPP